MTKADDAFWVRQFDVGGNVPGLWFDKAHDLQLAAHVLDGVAGFIDRDFQQGQAVADDRLAAAAVAPMLRAMAAECLLKGLWLKHGGILAETATTRAS